MRNEIEKYMIIITFISSFFTVFVLNGVILAVPEIAKEFGMSNLTQNWTLTIFTLVGTMLTIPAGQIAGKYGFKRTLSIANSIFLIGLIGSIIAFSTETFLISRIVQAIGIAFVNVCEIAIITLSISKESRGKALGIIITGVYLGTSASPVICGFLVHNFGWRSIFIFSIIFIALCVILLKMKITPEWKTNENDKIDRIGSVLYMVGISLLIYGFSALITTTGKISLVMGIIILVIYFSYELKQKSPVFDVNLFRTKAFTAYNLAGMFGYFAAMVFTTLINYHFQYVKGFNPELTGFILIVSPIVMSITAPYAGKLSDKMHPQKIATVGMVITTFSMIILSFLDKNTPLYIIILAMALQAFGTGLFSSPNLNAVMSSVDEKDAAFASAGQLATRAIGQSMSLGLLTLVFSWIMGNLELSPIYSNMIVQSSQIIFAVCSIACVFAIITSIIGIKADNKIKR
ncbi:MFS transporter [Methanobrevibacter sp.]|uniref:MFS transporter n=1 Tax=Methanobrevibacter sp. TaxID=66852 RepID=UPI0025E572AF|nr:MFS transporter [Methanobrevibacter sp.]MBQ6511942.1 MFS transporter [Methanobrevibacter sp.]